MSVRRAGVLSLAVAIAVGLVGCGSSDGQPQWNDADDFGWSPVSDPVTVVEGDIWRFDVGLEPDDTGEPPAPCLQPVVADQPLGCAQVDAEPGSASSWGASVRIGDERVIWRAGTIDDEGRPVEHFVVWSSASPEGRRLDPIVYRDVVSLLWIMEPGEAPWGYQLVAADGTLIQHITHLGLPAE